MNVIRSVTRIPPAYQSSIILGDMYYAMTGGTVYTGPEWSGGIWGTCGLQGWHGQKHSFGRHSTACQLSGGSLLTKSRLSHTRPLIDELPVSHYNVCKVPMMTNIICA